VKWQKTKKEPRCSIQGESGIGGNQWGQDIRMRDLPVINGCSTKRVFLKMDYLGQQWALFNRTVVYGNNKLTLMKGLTWEF